MIEETELMDCRSEEERLRDRLRELNRSLADLNSEAGEVEARRRTVQHQLVQTSKALQSIQAAQVRRDMAVATGSGPRGGGGR